MQLTDILAQTGGLQSMARELGVSESQAASGAAASQSGLDPSLLKKMLPMLAMMVAGFMSKQKVAGAMAQPAQTPGGLAGMLGGLLGGRSTGGAASGLVSMLDMNGDGNPLDDILRMAGKTGR